MKPAILFTFGLVFLLFFGCLEYFKSDFASKVQVQNTAGTVASIEAQAITNCISLCQSEKSKGNDLSKGPCLSNTISPDWVCDIAHSPRTVIDDDSANQCPFFAQGNAHHFVELDVDCNLIKKY